MSISLGVGAAVGVPAALPHDGDPIVPPGEEVVKPSNTFRNFFIFERTFVYSQAKEREKEDLAFSEFPEFSVYDEMQDPNEERKRRDLQQGRAHFLSLRCSLKSHRGISSCSLAKVQKKKKKKNAFEPLWSADYSRYCSWYFRSCMKL